MKMKLWALCKTFDFFKAIANGCIRIMERINGRLIELNKKWRKDHERESGTEDRPGRPST